MARKQLDARYSGGGNRPWQPTRRKTKGKGRGKGRGKGKSRSKPGGNKVEAQEDLATKKEGEKQVDEVTGEEIRHGRDRDVWEVKEIGDVERIFMLSGGGPPRRAVLDSGSLFLPGKGRPLRKEKTFEDDPLEKENLRTGKATCVRRFS